MGDEEESKSLYTELKSLEEEINKSRASAGNNILQGIGFITGIAGGLINGGKYTLKIPKFLEFFSDSSSDYGGLILFAGVGIYVCGILRDAEQNIQLSELTSKVVNICQKIYNK